jgi:large subunit ribosomal protein L30
MAELRELKKDELVDRAHELGVTGASSMKKDELVEALEAQERATSGSQSRHQRRGGERVMAALRITQVRSANGANPRQRDALRSLGLGRIGATTERDDDPTVRGALRLIDHLVRIER